MAEATAAETSMPAVLEPVAAARTLLILIEDVDVSVLVNAEVTAEVVLIASTYIPGGLLRVHARPRGPVREPGT
jgi:hypothetical protein